MVLTVLKQWSHFFFRAREWTGGGRCPGADGEDVSFAAGILLVFPFVVVVLLSLELCLHKLVVCIYFC